MKFLFSCFILCFVLINTDAGLNEIKNDVTNYFNNPTIKSFKDEWGQYKRGIEHSIELALKENFGEQGLNVYIRKSWNPLLLTKGFFVSDNMANVLFKEPYLTQFPHLRMPEVSFNLSSNVLLVAACVSKMFIEASYLMFRNQTDVVYATGPFDPYQTSPFALPQVQNMGTVAIVVDGCRLSGFAVASLSGYTVTLGHDTFSLSECKFSVEITSPGSGGPPVIAPYFTREQGAKLELLLTRPLREELIPKLQGDMFTDVNTSALLGSKVQNIQQLQRPVFEKAAKYMSEVVINLNKQFANENSGSAKLPDEILNWTDKYGRGVQDTEVKISNVTVSGLDSAYSSQSGGPILQSAMSIDDAVHFSAIQVLGTLTLNVGKAETEYAFYGEIIDMTFYTSVPIDGLGKADGTFIEWRKAVIRTADIPLIAPNALITGYLLNKLPKYMTVKMSQHFPRAVQVQASPTESLSDRGKTAPPRDQNVNGDDQSNDQYKSKNTDAVTQSDRLINEPMFSNGAIFEDRLSLQHKVDEAEENPAENPVANENLNVEKDGDEPGNNSTGESGDADQQAFAEDDAPQHVGGDNLNENDHENPDVKEPIAEEVQNGNADNKDPSNDQDGGDNPATEARQRKRKSFNKPKLGRRRTKVHPDYYRILVLREYDKPLSEDKLTLRLSDEFENREYQSFDIKYRLFTRNHPNRFITLDGQTAEPLDEHVDADKVDLSKRPIKVITHGWLSSADDESIIALKNAYLEKYDVSVIIIDWSSVTKTPYFTASISAAKVAEDVGRFLNAINYRYGVKGRSIHMIGHSLGAHMAGMAAYRTKLKIGRVTGLDPAQPYFERPEMQPPTERIDKIDATFVDIIHTSAGLLGFEASLGHADFYPNGGQSPQPGCADNFILRSICSHSKAWDYLTESILRPSTYLAHGCSNWEDFQEDNNCNSLLSLMGERADPNVKGNFYLDV